MLDDLGAGVHRSDVQDGVGRSTRGGCGLDVQSVLGAFGWHPSGRTSGQVVAVML